MASGGFDFIWNRFKELSQEEQVLFVENIYKQYPYSYKLGSMSEPERRFYDPKVKRPDGA